MGRLLRRYGWWIGASREHGAKGLVSHNKLFLEPEDANADEDRDVKDIERCVEILDTDFRCLGRASRDTLS